MPDVKTQLQEVKALGRSLDELIARLATSVPPTGPLRDRYEQLVYRAREAHESVSEVETFLR